MTDVQLLQRYRPFLHYDQLESYRADSAATMPEHVFDGGGSWAYANALRRSGGAVLASARPAAGQPRLDLAFLAAARYPSGETVKTSDYLDAYGRDYVADAMRLHANPLYANRCYGHVAREATGTRWLQYWFFYYYNDKNFLGIGLHEGDWEMIQLRLGADDRPNVVTYAQHNEAEGLRFADVTRKKVGAVEVPVVFVGRGSHASFAKAGRQDVIFLFPDYADGKGEKIRPAVETVDDDPSWVGWGGKWGSSDSSPRGPAQHRQWTDPAGFHREVAAAGARTRARARAAAPPAPPAPEIALHAVDDRMLVDYRFAARLPRSAALPALLAVSVDRADDDQPPATHAFPVRGSEGTVAHPLPLRPGTYTVRVVASSEEGASGPVVSKRTRVG
jgi:hypothetical protein